MMLYRITDGESIDEVVDTVTREDAIDKLYYRIYDHYGVYTYTETYRACGKVYQFCNGSWELVDTVEFVYDPTPPPCRDGTRSHDWADAGATSEGARVWRYAKCHCGVLRIREIDRDDVVSVMYKQSDDEDR